MAHPDSVQLARPRSAAAGPVGAPARTRVELSVVIPVYNEDACIDALWRELEPVLDRIGRPWEVVFVDDGSTDRGPERLLALARRRPEVRLVQLAANRGQTAALDAGFRAARGEWVVTLDADLQNPPQEIARLLEAAEGVDLVYGRRRVRHDSWVKRVASRIGNGVRNAITGHRVHDTGCSLKLYRRDALRRIPLFTGMHRFLPTLFAFHGFAVREIEVDHRQRVAGHSKYGNLTRATRGLHDCLAVRWMRGRSLHYEARELTSDPGDPER